MDAVRTTSAHNGVQQCSDVPVLATEATGTAIVTRVLHVNCGSKLAVSDVAGH